MERFSSECKIQGVQECKECLQNPENRSNSNGVMGLYCCRNKRPMEILKTI